MKNILIVDADAENRSRMISALRHWGYRVAESVEAANALALAQEAAPDLWLIAASLADMSGFDLCRKIHELPELRTRPIILLTPRVDNEIRVKGARVRADGYLLTPVLLSELFDRVRFYVTQPELHSADVLPVQ